MQDTSMRKNGDALTGEPLPPLSPGGPGSPTAP